MELNRFGLVLRASVKHFEKNDGWAHSSHIALSLLIAIFPFCIFSLSLAVQLSSDVSKSDLVEFVFGTWPEPLSEPIEREISAVLETSGAAKLTVSSLLVVFFASNGVDAIRTSITAAYSETDMRSFWKARLLCVVFVIAGALVLSAAGALTIAFPAYFEFAATSSPDLQAHWFSSGPLRVTIALALLLFFLVSCHLWLPVHRRPLSSVMPGVLLTIVLWAICAQSFAFYIKHFGSYSVTYAGLAGIMATLIFMYFMSAIFIYGAELNGRLAEEVGQR
ncbi:MAG: YihY/virulence factor BrkB family protein [Roseobacter sp.]